KATPCTDGSLHSRPPSGPCHRGWRPPGPPGRRCGVVDTAVSVPTQPSPRTPRAKRQRRIEMRLSGEEYAALEAKAQAAGMTMTALLRDHVGQVHIRDRETERRRVGLLNRINANLNM